MTRPGRGAAVLAGWHRDEDRGVDALTRFSGSLAFVWLHALWFGGWIAVNLGLLGRAAVFDPYPFGLLTLIVSLESIFLSAILLISQNRSSLNDATRDDIAYEAAVRDEIWTEAIGAKLGIDADAMEKRVQAFLASVGSPSAQTPDPSDDVPQDTTGDDGALGVTRGS